jgi:hypothetical protein
MLYFELWRASSFARILPLPTTKLSSRTEHQFLIFDLPEPVLPMSNVPEQIPS